MSETGDTIGRDDDDKGAATAGDRETDIGGSHSGGSPGEAGLTGAGQEQRSGDKPISHEEAQESDTDFHGGTPDDLALGTRKTEGLDPDAGGADELSDQPAGD